MEALTRPGGIADLIARRLASRSAASSEFFEREAERLARCCHRMAERFARGGRLIAIGASPQARSDARHVAVEFVHPVIVGKRALPAVALTAEGGPITAQLASAAEPGDVVICFGLGEGDRGEVDARAAVAVASELGCMTLRFGPGGPEHDDDRDWVFLPPGADPFVRQELIETLYHLLWELVHVFFDRRGPLEGREAGPRHDGGAARFLYPFLSAAERDVGSVIDDVRGSVLAKAAEVGRLREQTLEENAGSLAAAAAALRQSFDAGGQLLAFGNGGSATDAIDLVADFRAAPASGWPARRAIDLTEDTPIITAVANDVGVEEVFQRQVISHGREGDVAIAFSTSGGSENLITALAEARRRGLGTIAMVGYDGGRIAAERLADHLIVSRSQQIPRIQEAQASAYHLLRELVEVVGPG